ncbi:coiled-coil domain-containing protein 39 [Alosa sapidissima]|uniref:coiled-coil domain-containing protein 39 n=1 Tax=Alosa sapidissima TaxID=34773 RepID=UPI001C08882D|nr:coiled-coil domain-containing protein 39 [Alosa sapidissima]
MSDALLSEVGWDEGFAIPVANAENKALEDELQRKQRDKTILENKLAEYKDRINAMTEHLKNVKQELSHTQALCKAREKETDTEKHFKALAEREMGRLQQEIAQLEKELGSLRERHTAQENSIFKTTQTLEELSNRLNWDQKTLDAWLDESARRDEDTMAILKYAQQDESQIKELTLNIEKLNLQANQKRKALDNELTETITAQIGLDKTAENFRQVHAERQELICQWESTIEQMKKRDQEMQDCAAMITKVNQDIRERHSVIKEKTAFLESEVENNKEYEKKIGAAERQAAKLRQQFQEQEENRTRLHDELESLKSIVDRAASDVENVRAQIASMKKDIEDKSTKVKDAKLHNAALEEKLASVTEATMSVEERAAQMEQLLKEEEQNIKEVDLLLHRHREAVFRKNQELQALRLKEKDSVSEVSGSKAAITNLDSRIRKVDQNTLKQQEIIYSQDFQIQLLERKMSRLQGEVNTEEKQALEKRVEELSDTLEERRKTTTMLTTQLKKLQDDIRCVRKEMEKTGAEKRNLTTKIEELNLFNDTSDKELKKLRLKKQDTMVEDNILKLEIKRLRDLLYDKADRVLSLEKRRLQLQTAMGEREEEIRVHGEMLTKQFRITDQERQALSAEVHERMSKIDKMRKKYEILTMQGPEGEEEKSQAFYVIKAAQEKEELQRQGDTLDAKIRKAEKEVLALENTLHVVNSRNHTYRKSFNRVTESSEEYQEKLKLEGEKRAAEDKYRLKRCQIKELQEDIQSMNNTLEILLQEETEQNGRTDETQSRILSLNMELASQKEKLDRVNKQCTKLTKEIRSTKQTTEKTFEERDVQLRELKDLNKKVNHMLLEAMDRSPDLESALVMYFTQANLLLPSPGSAPGSRQGSKATSARSSASVRSSGSSASSSPRGLALQSPPVKTLELGLGLSVTSPPLATTSPQSSRPSSSRIAQRKSP